MMPIIRPPDKRRRKPSLSTALAEARKAGKAVKSAEVYGDHIKLTFGDGKETSDDEVETWVTKHAHQR
jgi:hypothetical protein